MAVFNVSRAGCVAISRFAAGSSTTIAGLPWPYHSAMVCITTKNAGTKKTARSVDASMPPKTACRAPAVRRRRAVGNH